MLWGSVGYLFFLNKLDLPQTTLLRIFERKKVLHLPQGICFKDDYLRDTERKRKKTENSEKPARI